MKKHGAKKPYNSAEWIGRSSPQISNSQNIWRLQDIEYPQKQAPRPVSKFLRSLAPTKGLTLSLKPCGMLVWRLKAPYSKPVESRFGAWDSVEHFHSTLTSPAPYRLTGTLGEAAGVGIPKTSREGHFCAKPLPFTGQHTLRPHHHKIRQAGAPIRQVCHSRLGLRYGR